ncbi:MAG: hypothetical protein O2971_04080 [Proteobacteria bacterium]|nr:hypothetical protein [Pseudomonadota bacterium]
MTEQQPPANPAFTSEVVYSLPYRGEIREDIVYGEEFESLDIFYPDSGTGPFPAVVFVIGFPDPGFEAMTGKKLKDLTPCQSWARLIAASRMAAVLYATVDPARSSVTCLEYLRSQADALAIDADRIGLWACSGNVPVAIHLLNSVPGICCANLNYGYMLDLNDSTTVQDASAQFRFANPNHGRDSFPENVDLLVVKAGKDEFPGINDGIDAFVVEGRARKVKMELIEYSQGVHAFDVLDSSAQSIEIVQQMLEFFTTRLAA